MDSKESRQNTIERLKERLYGLAFAFRETKLWRKVKERQAIAVEREDGEILYACILDEGQGENWVTVFTEDELYNFDLVLESRLNTSPEEITDFYRMISIGCRQCRLLPKQDLTEWEIREVQGYAKKHGASLAGKCAYPDFVRYAAYYEPRFLDEPVEMERLGDVLEALCALSGEIGKMTAARVRSLIPSAVTGKTDRVPVLKKNDDGKYALAGDVPFPAWEEPLYPVSNDWDPAVAATIRKKRRRGKIAVGVIWGGAPILKDVPILNKEDGYPDENDSEEYDPPKDNLNEYVPDEYDPDEYGEDAFFEDFETEDVYFYPAIFLTVDIGSESVPGCDIYLNYKDHYENMAAKFLQILAGRGSRPRQVIARDERTYKLLEKAMEAAGIELSVDGNVEEFLAAESSLQEEVFGTMSLYEDFDPWDEDDDEEEPGEWSPDELFGEGGFSEENYSDESMEEELRGLLQILQSAPDDVLAVMPAEYVGFLHMLAIFPKSPKMEKEYEALMARLERLRKGRSSGSGTTPFTAAAKPDRLERTGKSAKKNRGKGKKGKDEETYSQMSLLDTDLFDLESEEREKFIRDYLWDEEEESEEEEESGNLNPVSTGKESRYSAQILEFPGNKNEEKTGDAGERKEAASCSYVIRVSLRRGFYRDIQIDSDASFDAFHRAIQRAVEFDDDHLYAFFMDNKAWSRKAGIYSPRDEGSPYRADKITLRQCSLSVGSRFMYLFDFGDEWRFQCRVTKILDVKTTEAHTVKGKGEPPRQYG